MAAFVIGAVAVVAFGTGYKSTRALTNDESAWLRKGDTIVDINGPSARFDAVVSDKPVPVAKSASDPLQVVQEPNGKVYTADPLTHKVYEIQLDRMTPVAGPNGTSVLAAGKVAYIVDRANRTLTAVNPRTMAPGATIRIPGPITGQAIAPNGTVYIGQADGSLTIVSHGKVHTEHIASRHSSLEVTMVGPRPVAVDVTHGRLYPLATDGRPTRSISIPGGSGQPFEVPPTLPGQEAWVVHGSQLVGIDLASGHAHTVSLPSGHTFGSPVVNAGRVFVPDDTSGQVLQYHATGLTALPPVAVPAGAPGVHDIEAFAKNGDVWIDNPSSEDAAMVSASGTVSKIDKGTGNQVVNPHARPAPRSPASPAAPSQTFDTSPALSGPQTPDSVSTSPPAPVTGAAGAFGAATAPGTGTAGGAGVSGSGAAPDPAPTSGTGTAGGGAGTFGKATSPQTPSTPTPTTTTDPTPSPTTTTDPTAPSTTTTELVPVPAPGSRETPTAYCARVRAAGLKCTPADQGQAKVGTPTNVVLSINPAAGTKVSPGSNVTAYFDSKATPTGKVPSVVGQDTQTACSTLASSNPVLQCSQSNQGEAPAGAKAGVVFAQSPPAGTTVPVSTVVTIKYYSATPVPAFQAGEDPNTYCAQVDTLGLACTPTGLDTAPPGASLNTVFATSPSAGSPATAGQVVTAQYYSGFAPVTVPSCVGDTTCPPTPGISWTMTPLSIPSASISCNVVYQQSQVAGTPVPYGTSVTANFDPNCAVWFGEYHHPDNIWRESTDPSLGSPWIQQSVNGWAYPYKGGCNGPSKAGTTPLFQFQYQGGEPYYFSTGAGPNQPGWVNEGAIACVFSSPPQGGGTVAVYDHFINPNSGQPEKHSWEYGASPAPSNPNPDWYQPDHQN